MSNNPKINQ